jgi:hypothetical protein
MRILVPVLALSYALSILLSENSLVKIPSLKQAVSPYRMTLKNRS